MERLWRLAAATALTMAGVAGVVFGLGDRTTLVPPPESAAEGFVRALETGRYGRALPYLSAAAEARVGREGVEAAAGRLRARAGEVLDVRGETLSIDGDRASARALVETRDGELVVELPMVRENGVWAIHGLGELED